MLNNDIINAFKKNGFCVKKSISRLENEKGIFEPLLNSYSNKDRIRSVKITNSNQGRLEHGTL